MYCYLFYEFYTPTQTSHSIYNWWKDIWLPAAGAIAIPLLVWWLSWLFGASRAEQQKELRDLRNNLNLLSSILLSTFQSLLSLKENFEKYNEELKRLLTEMRDFLKAGKIPPIRKNQNCNGCSMKDVCMPSMRKIPDLKKEIKKIEREPLCENS